MRNQENVAKSAGWNPWPVSIIAFFAVAIVGFGIFVAFCNSHAVDLVAPDYYEQELRYQGQMERAQNAQALSPATISYDRNNQSILIVLPSNAAAESRGSIELYRPSEAALDRKVTLALDSAGKQVIDARNLKPGLWKVRVSWSAGKRDCLVDQKVVVGEGS